ncbi:MAG: AMP-binding protein, partial [Alphaproteobacteria bacterium]|nr:AMP-binding protein [Alphaproteobacteria bacterium]
MDASQGEVRVAAEFYDPAEHRDPAEREAAQMAALPRIVAVARQDAPGYRDRLAGVDPAGIVSREALARLPLTRKSELIEVQRRQPPLGGFATVPLSAVARVFASPGPIYEIEARRADFYRMARALYAAGIRPGDLIHNTFSYHLTPAGAMLESAAAALGCPVIPAGTGQTEQQLRTIADLRPVAYVGTPSFLKILLDRARETATDASSLKKALVGAEAFPAVLREEFRGRGIAALQCYGTADVGLIAYETVAEDGSLCDGMVVDEGVILEIVEPGGTTPVLPGEVGEVVVTALTPEYPLIRFATGDLSALLTEPSPCGRTNHRIKGWLGR